MLKNKRDLPEVTILRPFLIMGIIITHSFAPYCGVWDMPIGANENIYYDWINPFLANFLMQAFV